MKLATFLRQATALAVVLVATGCATVRPSQLPVSEVIEGSRKDRLVASQVPPIEGLLSIEEAIARALRYNLDQRVSRAEQALATRQLDVTKQEMLPNIMASAGYTTRDEDLTRRSVDSVTGGPSNANPFISQERSHIVSKLGVTWNLLDFGVGYYNAKQQANRIMIAQERRRKSVHLLIQDVQTAFWRAYSAQVLRSQIAETIELGESALADAKIAEEERLRAPLDSLRFQRQILENLRTLESLDQELSTAKLELARLINVKPGVDFVLAEPSTKFTDELAQVPAAALEEIAIRSNADLREQYYNDRNARLEARKALVRLFPRLSFDYNFNYDNDKFLINNTWNEAGAQLAYSLLNIWNWPLQKRLSQAGIALAEQRRIATLMSIISQVHISRLQYTNARRLFDRADALTQVEERIVVQMANREQAAVQGKLETVSSKTSLIISLLRRYQALAQVYAAESRVQATLGFDPGIGIVDRQGLDELKASVTKSLTDWRSGLASVPAPPAVASTDVGDTSVRPEQAPAAEMATVISAEVPTPPADAVTSSSDAPPAVPVAEDGSVASRATAEPQPAQDVEVASADSAAPTEPQDDGPAASAAPAEPQLVRKAISEPRIQLGAYRTIERAMAAARNVDLPRNLAARRRIVADPDEGELYRVVIVGFPSRSSAVEACRELIASGIDCFPQS